MADTPKRKRGRPAHTPEERTHAVLMRVKPETMAGFALLQKRLLLRNRTEVVDCLVAAAVSQLEMQES